MIHYIENECLKIGVKEFGCELTSVYSKVNGCEYLWQGNPEYWAGQSPILFPIVGRLIDDKYCLNGKEYEMPKHGFARKMDWTFEGADDTSMTFRLSETEDTLAIYPYHFDVIVKFSVEGNKLTVSHDIVNKNDDVMYCSLGAHPAFNCEIGDKLIFDGIRLESFTGSRFFATSGSLTSSHVIMQDSYFDGVANFGFFHGGAGTGSVHELAPKSLGAIRQLLKFLICHGPKFS